MTVQLETPDGGCVAVELIPLDQEEAAPRIDAEIVWRLDEIECAFQSAMAELEARLQQARPSLRLPSRC